MIRSSLRALLTGTACILLAIALTANEVFFGSLIGYWVGFVYTLWFQRESLRIADLDIRPALRRMNRSLMARLGMITLVVVAVARFHRSWLYSLTFGIVAGVLISFIIVAIQQKNQRERGDK
jgi:membrane protein YqaA with SNARE-associated domain